MLYGEPCTGEEAVNACWRFWIVATEAVEARWVLSDLGFDKSSRQHCDV